MLVLIIIWVIVFSLIILLILGLIKVIDFLFLYRQKIKLQSLRLGFSILGIFFLLIISSLIVLGVIKSVVNISQLLTRDSVPKNNTFALISRRDCQPLLDTIKETENAIYQQENHRYIEEEAPLFAIQLEYHKGFQKLREQLVKYENLAAKESENIYAQNYGNQIAEQLKKKAELFKERIKIKPDKVGRKKIYELLEEMDKVTAERQKLIEQVEQQCGKAK
jgi:hypothetical protein